MLVGISMRWLGVVVLGGVLVLAQNDGNNKKDNRNRRQTPFDNFFNRHISATQGRGGLRPYSNSNGIFSVAPFGNQPWWKGAHVCMTKKEEEVEGVSPESLLFSLQSTQCSESLTTHTCITKIRTANESKNLVEKYTCCHGYTRRPDGPGCVEADLKDLSETLQIIGTNDFGKLVDDAKITKKGGADMNITVFAPTNAAIKIAEAKKAETDDKNEVSPADMANSHMVEGYYQLADLVDEQKIVTLDGKSSIRFNEFYNPHKVLTANCVPIVAADNFHKNGVVHVVDGTLPTPSKSVKEILANDPKFETFNEILSRSGELLDKLDDPEAHYTVFAPTQDAFKDIDAETLEMWRNGEGCVDQLLQGHVVPHTICTSAVPQQARVRNVLRSPIMLQKTPDGRVTAEGVEIEDKDMVATNGVVHAIKNVMLSQTSKSLLDTLKAHKLTDLVHLIESNQLGERFATLKNFTFFAPTEEAIKDVSLKEWDSMKQEQKIQPLFLYHTTQSKIGLKSLFNNMIMPSQLENSQIRVNVYSRNSNFDDATYTAQCARVVSRPTEVCGGSIYFVDKVLRQPEVSIWELLEKNKNLQVFRKLVTKANLESQLKDNAGPFTVLAPTDEAFKKLTREEMESLEKGEGVEALVKTHIIPDMLCSGGINHNNAFAVQEHRNLDGKSVSAQRSLRGHVYFGGARVEDKDLTANNGVVHVLDRVLNAQPEPKPQPNPVPNQQQQGTESRRYSTFDFPQF
ncbi:transforming growth factor-beta-induced protein ig-h3 [Galendromus occidentalis]|uniref:Transforming growth factor-beta-induced protein ig-h3 n=1 Tax=Galendromus occidentalis TaxID=34638 RepID=A0AAJ6QXH3_9ACAR|nr:transforming growth factor-beta-induced protein ig-h3 [Galendromus occidentalis]